ncbi:hypothetical protein ABZ777_06885 [Micromonospora parva]|uniref:hypothetical protein n=1 Tax=Micromonospora parva TaxID=1464048 RepID=UPI0033C4A830
MVHPNSARALRPLRQFALPRWRTLLRAGLVAALLGLAAAVLQTPAECPPAVVPSNAPSVADNDPPRQLPSNAPSVADDPPRQVDESRSAASGGASPPDSTGTAGPTS